MPSQALREPVEGRPRDFPSCLTVPACNAWDGLCWAHVPGTAGTAPRIGTT